MNLLAFLKNRSSLFWTLTGLIGVVVVGVADFLTGRELAFSLFYLIPIVLVTWFSGRNLGLVLSAVSALGWFAADALARQSQPEPIIMYWNAFVRLSFFAMVPFLFSALQALEHEKELARLDDLTGIANRRRFFEMAETELDRSQRYQRPFTFVYFDVDNLKPVNDLSGHQIGDRLLRSVAQRAKLHLRRSDFLARLGGDEFVVILPETGPTAAHNAVLKLQGALLDEMRSQHWSVTFSFGVLTCLDAHLSADEMLKKADDLMYSVKKSGKNGIAYGIFSS
jgi:diguanylate cyclase (GGDEF)-like protein